jgi:uncharacterized protein YecE (DUF72 family)
MAGEPPIRVGCCGFAAARGRYFKTFPVVEINITFYQPPEDETLRRWRQEAPADFEFTLKAWQLITHEARSPTYRRLRERLSAEELKQAGAFQLNDLTRRAWERMLQCARLLGARRVLFQCPASFGASDENLDRLGAFFGEVPREGLTFVWEPRGAWPVREVSRLCRELDLVHCVDPFLDLPVTRGGGYFRMHGVGGYQNSYSDGELVQIRDLIRGHRPALVLFNNKTEFEDARRFQDLVSGAGQQLSLL